MSEPHQDEAQPTRETPKPAASRGRSEDPMDDEEKILAGRADVNMPALLTRDVQGG